MTTTAMDEFGIFADRMSKHVNRETGLIVLGVAVAFLGLLAILTQYFELSTTVSFEKSFIAPYIKFIYACFIKPHAGNKDGGQQSALESFYATQVSRDMPRLAESHQCSGLDIRCHPKTTP